MRVSSVWLGNPQTKHEHPEKLDVSLEPDLLRWCFRSLGLWNGEGGGMQMYLEKGSK